MKAFGANHNLQFYSKTNVLLMMISITALVMSFLISNINLDFSTKLTIFTAELLLYSAGCVVFLSRRTSDVAEPKIINGEMLFTEDIDEKLLALEEAHQFFGASLKSADMFRLVASRLDEIIPFAACAFYSADLEKKHLKSQFAVGVNSKEFSGLVFKSDEGLAGKTFQSGAARYDAGLSEDKSVFPFKTLDNLTSGIAVPLKRGVKVFGVLVLYGDGSKQFDRQSLTLLEAAAVRVAPLFLSSQAFESILNSALTDSLTNIPNERAFYLVLENQIAEAQRFPKERPLTVLGIDIKNFDEINSRFGHAAGDRLLTYTAETIKKQLRQMDFLSRSTGDEFLAVLPTASVETASEIIERIEKSFTLYQFQISKGNRVQLDLNFGAASFGRDGETADDLIKHARLKKHQSKSVENKSNILWFSKEFIN